MSESTKPPSITGMLIKNENLATSSLLPPASVPAHIVEPLLEIPGSTATACANAIGKTVRQHKGKVEHPHLPIEEQGQQK